MIQSKFDLRRYLEMDARMYGVSPRRFYFYSKEVWKFVKSLRLYEYY